MNNHEHPCPKCGKEMEYLETDSDGDGVFTADVPECWSCECGHIEPVEHDDEPYISEEDRQWPQAENE